MNTYSGRIDDHEGVDIISKLQSIDNIRPAQRSLPGTGNNSPIIINHPPTTAPPPSPPSLAAHYNRLYYSLPLVSGGQYTTSIASAGINSRPSSSFAVDLVVGFRDISVDLAKCARDVVYQNYYYYILTKLLCAHLLLFLMFLALAAAAFCVNLNHESHSTSPLITKPFMHPPNATHILLPDGRHLAYHENARFSIIAPHPLLSSRLAGIPGLKISLMQEFGVRLITYDIPGFGRSDPHPNRNLKTSAADMLQLSYTMGIADKFWVVGYSSGSLHAWAALKYIPDRLAGAFMVSPMINPYELGMTKDERHRTWNKWSRKRKFMYFVARKFPRFLAYLYCKSLMPPQVVQRENWLASSLGKRDRAFIEGEMFQEFWQRDVEESLRQENTKPLMEEVVLQVSSWGFSLKDLNVKKKDKNTGLFLWLKSMYSAADEESTTSLGTIHIWQGMDDKVVPPSMAEYVERVLPGAMVHKLFYHGHLTYFYFCHECHREMFSIVFGEPKGPLTAEVDCTPTLEDTNEIKKVRVTGSQNIG